MFDCRPSNGHQGDMPYWSGQASEFRMMTSSNGNIFRVTGHLCGEFTGPGEFPTQRPVTRSFGVFFDLRLNKRLSKQSWGWWFETLSCPLWRQCNGSVRTPLAPTWLPLTLICIWNGTSLAVNYGISNTIALEIPQLTTKAAIWCLYYISWPNAELLLAESIWKTKPVEFASICDNV